MHTNTPTLKKPQLELFGAAATARPTRVVLAPPPSARAEIIDALAAMARHVALAKSEEPNPGTRDER